MLTEKSSGKSGSFFFHTFDGKYLIKTIKPEESDVFRSMIQKYHNYILENFDTLLPRYYGLYQLKCYKKDK